MPTSIDSIEVKIDGQTAEAWDGILAQFDDASIYQTWAYGAVRWGCNNLSEVTLSSDQARAMAKLLRNEDTKDEPAKLVAKCRRVLNQMKA